MVFANSSWDDGNEIDSINALRKFIVGDYVTDFRRAEVVN